MEAFQQFQEHNRVGPEQAPPSPEMALVPAEWGIEREGSPLPEYGW